MIYSLIVEIYKAFLSYDYHRFLWTFSWGLCDARMFLCTCRNVGSKTMEATVCHVMKKDKLKGKLLGFNLVNKVLTIFTQGKSLHIVPRYFLNAPTEVKIEVDLSFLWDIHVLRRSFIKGASVTFLSTSVQSGQPTPCQYRAYSDAQGVAREFKWGWRCSWLFRRMPEDL